MEDVVKIQEEKVEYVNRETGEILTNPIEIEFYKCNQNDIVIDNGLIGSFTKEGKYSIEKKYLINLVEVRKIVVESFDYKYVLLAKAGDEELNLTLVIEDLIAEEKKIATLRFIEKIIKDDGTEELLKTIVATYKDDADMYFVKKAFKVFNIFEKEDIEGKANDEVLLDILLRIKHVKWLKVRRLLLLDHISSAYVDKILAILRAHPGKFSEYVLRKYGEGLISLKDFISKENYFILVKRMLDGILNPALKQLKDENLLAHILKIQQEYSTNYKNLHQELIVAHKEEINKKTEKKQEIVENKPQTFSSAKKKTATPKIKAAGKKKVVKGAAKTSQTYFDLTQIYKQHESRPKQDESNKGTKVEAKKPKQKDEIGLFIKNLVDYSLWLRNNQINGYEKRIDKKITNGQQKIEDPELIR